jgi:NADPH-dependent F420 reductase
MKIGVIGSGNVGGTLGSRWAQAGHQVTFSSRNPDSKEMKDLIARAGSSARAASVADAAASSEVVLFATPWNVAEAAIRSAGELRNKVVIDAMNPLLPDLSGLTLGTTTSAAEQVQQWAAGAKVVKAFNTIGYNIMADAKFGSEKALLAYCGDDAGAKQMVRQLAVDLGFDPLDAGPLTQARLLEPFALLWISLAYKAGQGREIAFKLLRRS